MNARLLGSHVSLAAGLDKSGHQHSEHDPENPVSEPHATHGWILMSRWAECGRCGMRDYYPGARLTCAKITPPRDRLIPIGEALAILAQDLQAFGEWWRSRGDLGTERPSMDEWGAEFTEWRIKR